MASIRRSQLIADLANCTGLPKTQAKQAVNAVLDAMREHLGKGERIQLSGFGSFKIRDQAERQGANLKTKEKMTILVSTPWASTRQGALCNRLDTPPGLERAVSA